MISSPLPKVESTQLPREFRQPETAPARFEPKTVSIATADTLDYMDEDLAWMKDIAEREAINRYVTAEITVEQHFTEFISKVKGGGILKTAQFQIITVHFFHDFVLF